MVSLYFPKFSEVFLMDIKLLVALYVFFFQHYKGYKPFSLAYIVFDEKASLILCSSVNVFSSMEDFEILSLDFGSSIMVCYGMVFVLFVLLGNRRTS